MFIYGAIDDLYQKNACFFKIDIIFSMHSIILSTVSILYIPICFIQLVAQERLTSLHQRELTREMAVTPLPPKMLD